MVLNGGAGAAAARVNMAENICIKMRLEQISFV
jgi:hypothetical protein